MKKLQLSSKRISKKKYYKLVQAANNGNLKKVEHWLGKGVPVDYVWKRENYICCSYIPPITALAAAIDNDYLDIAEVLLKAGANTSIEYEGLTPLHQAVNNCNIKAVILLLNYDVDVDERDGNNMTPLHRAIQNRASKKIVKVLLEAGAKVNVRSNDNNILWLICYKGYIDMAKILMTYANEKIDTKKLYECKNEKGKKFIGNLSETAIEYKHYDLSYLLNSYARGEYPNPLKENKKILKFSMKLSPSEKKSYASDEEENLKEFKEKDNCSPSASIRTVRSIL
jgi:ankyrin repeat protein